MPRVTWDWEAEYTDPVSEAEDKAAEEKLAQEMAEIMRDIALCRMEDDDDEEDRWRDCYLDHELEHLDELQLDYEQEDYLYWSNWTMD